MSQTIGAHASSANASGSIPYEVSGGKQIPEARGGSSTARLADETSQGRTSIAASVVQKVAGIAAREISGVHSTGGGVSRAFGVLRERIPGGSGTSSTPGAQVEVGEKQSAIDLDNVIEHGASVVDLARAVRRNIVNSVERMTELEVIAVNDLHLPSDDEGGSGAEISRPRAE